MATMRPAVVVLAVLLPVFRSIHAEAPPATRAAAESCLVALRAAVTEANFAAMGFGSSAEVAAVDLGEPFRVVFVDTVNWSVDPDSSSGAITEYDYPAKIDDRPCCLVAVEKIDGVWEATGFGGAGFLQALLAVERDIHVPRDSCYVVKVPKLDDCFVAHRRDGRLMLRPLFDNPGLHFFEGRSSPVDSVIISVRQYYGGIGNPN